jgi:hypothetical protein
VRRPVCPSGACSVVTDVALNGSLLYVSTFGGVGISSDAGRSFTHKTRASGLGADRVNAIVYAPATNVIHAATEDGWSYSSHGGHATTFTNVMRVGQGLPSVGVNDIHVAGTMTYLATTRGLAICT